MSEAATTVAIIGMACRVPGADSIAELWRGLRERRDSLTEFDPAQLLRAGVPQSQLDDPRYVRAAQLIPDALDFDPDYFGFADAEAELLDPQQRQFLECAATALQDGGYDIEPEGQRIGVYAGAGLNTYQLSRFPDAYRSGSTFDRYRLMLAGDKDFMATRVSHRLDLHGPSINVGTACSTSLVAVHLAALAVLTGECEMALAGGSHFKFPQFEGYLSQERMIFSPDGRCRAFDERAAGTVLGDGVGAVLLKPLERAIEDGDQIYATVIGSAVNNDGADKLGFTAPSVDGQASVIRDALTVADCDPTTVGYIEAHGTATPLGDQVEVEALRRAYGDDPDAPGCAIGSVKTNIGHLDCAAGVIGLIKAALMLRHGEIVPSAHFERPNPALGLDRGRFTVAARTAAWPRGEGPRRAAVSSFGIGGTNAHAILEEPPPAPARERRDEPELLLLSARTEAGLGRASVALGRFLHETDCDLGDIAYTLALGRREHRFRRAVICRDRGETALALALGDREETIDGDAAEDAPAAARELPALIAADGDLRRAAELWVGGAPVDWRPFYAGQGRGRVSLPTYPFERRELAASDDRKGGRSSLVTRLGDLPVVEQRQAVLAMVEREVERLLGPQEAGGLRMDAPLAELGLESLQVLELCDRLEGLTGLELPASTVFDSPTPRALAASICDEAVQAGEERPPQPAPPGVQAGSLRAEIEGLDVGELVSRSLDGVER
jgi:phthiocerol/phenolphthiocerol synthesis type-I polyketide synthase E